MARTTARALAVALVVLPALAACAPVAEQPADPAPAAAVADGEIQLVDAPAQSAGLTGDGRGETPASAPAGEAAPATPPAKWVQLSVNESAIGDTVTEVRGFALYRFAGDSAEPPATTCVDQCALRWPPVLIQSGGRVFVDGLDKARAGAIRRPDGSVQVTIGGWPVYRFADDTVPGEFNGQGLDDKWFTFRPDGTANDTLVGVEDTKPAEPDATAGISEAQSQDGPVIVDDDGATLYVYARDETDPPASNCADACRTLWQPVVAKNDGRVTVTGIDEKRVWWLRREDGTKQVTLDGAPLYRNAADKSAGTVIASAEAQGWTAAR
ncbi:hypothetical protein [Catenuloplanes japonicus]|uniref:hypothetical protein n=1 Tax=Catenuloplanes japonicus TaxID=33876 RepID=UPI0012F9F760|nr:hypothetical protein [Catenuloplanes japonicus]